MKVQHKPLNQQVMVITGASSGIGLATAEAAAEAGVKLVLAARSTQTLDKICQRLEAAGTEVLAVTADVADRAALQRVADQAMARFGRIDTWVNDAGVSIFGRLEETSDEDARRLFDVNFWGVVNGSLVALPHLKTFGGVLINVGSEVSDAVIPLQGMYSASKHAVKGYTDALRVEVEEIGRAPVTITLIQPTAVNTPFPENARNYMDKEPKLPTPQIEPQDVAAAILKAAVEGGRDVKVGAMSKINTTLSKIAPAFGDKMSAMQVDRQQKDQPPQNPDGALNRPSEKGRTHGVDAH